MKKTLLFVFLGAAFLLFPHFAFAVEFPKAIGFVNDFAGVLSVQSRAVAEQELSNYEKKTSNEVSVAIVQSFEGLDRFSYAQELFTAWKIGKADKNNGILFLIGVDERQAFINVGRGLEGALPDSVAGSILRNDVFPQFKKGDYEAGVRAGIASIIAATRGEYKADETASADSENGFPIIPFVWFGFILLSWLGSFLARSKSWWPGGVIGGVCGAIGGFIFWSGVAIAISAVVFGGLGLLFDFIVSRNYAYRKAHGLPTDFRRSGGGFWFWGGGGGFGGGGSGGFGGFGGGGSGGGGAGGSW